MELDRLVVALEASTALLRQQMADAERVVERTTAGMNSSLDKVNTLFGLMDKAASQSARNMGASLARGRREADLNAWGVELDRLQAKYDKGFAAAKRYEAEIAELDRAHKLGAVSADVYRQALAEIDDTLNPAIQKTKALAAAEADLDSRARRLREGLDPAIKAKRQFNDAVAEADELLDKGKIGYAEYTAAVAKAREGLNATVAAHREAGRAGEVSAGQVAQARRIVTANLINVGNVAVATRGDLAMMAAPLPDVLYGLRLMGGGVAAVATAATALAVGVGAVIAVTERYSSSIREVERVNRLTGGVVGLTTGALVEQSDALAATAGLSRASAREIQAAYVSTGRIGTAVLGGLVEVTKDWAALTGQDVAKASDELARFFTDPAQAAEELTRSINLFSDAQLQAIRNAQAQGNVGQAQALLLDGIRQRAAGAAEQVSGLSKAWDSAGRFLSDFLDSLGRANGLQTTEQRVGALADEVERLRDAANADAMRVFAETGGGVPAEWVPVDDRFAARGAGSAGWDARLDAAGRYYEASAQAAGDAFTAFVTGESEAVKRLDKAFKDLSRAVDPVVQAQQNLLNVEKLLDLAVEEGVASRSEAARVLGLYREQVDAVAVSIAQLGQQARLLSLPEGFERRFATLLDQVTKGGKEPISGDAANDLRAGLTDVARGETADATARTERQAAAQRLLAGAITDAAKAQAQARVAFSEQLIQYPELGAATAKTALATKDFGAYVKTLPPDLQKLWQAMDAGAAAQVAGSITAATVQMDLQTAAAGRLADAAGRGEAAQRRANIENQVAAAGLHGLSAATRAALEAQEDFTRAQIHHDFAGQIQEEVQANERLAAAIGKGADAARQAELHNKAVAQTLREVPYPKAGQDTTAWNRALAENVRLLSGQRNAADNVDLTRYLAQLKDARKGLEFQRSTLGMSEDAKALAQAEFEASEYVRQRYGDYEKLDPATKTVADNVMAQAKANATLSTEIKHAESAYAAVGDAIDNGIVRPLESAVDAIVKGQGESVKWGNLLKGAFASVAVDAVKMATINPLMNMAGIGSYRPSLWDLPMLAAGGSGSPSAVQVQAMPGGGQSLTSSVTNWGLSKAGSWAMDKLGLNPTQSIMDLTLWGGSASTAGMEFASAVGPMSAAYGAPSFINGVSTAIVANPAMVGPGIVQAGSLNAANGVALAGNTGALNAAYSGTVTGAAGTPGVTLGGVTGGVLAPAMLGGMGGAMLSNQFMGGSKVGGAVTGAALGAGAAWGAQAMGIGASLGPWGIVAAAVIAAIMAAIGSQKPPQPYGGGWIQTDSTGKITRSDSGGENGVNGSDLLDRAKSTNSVMTAINQAAYISYGKTTPLWLGTDYQGDRGDEKGKGHSTYLGGWENGVLVSKSDNAARIALDIYQYFAKEMEMVNGQYKAKTGSQAEKYGFEAPNLVVKALLNMGSVTEETAGKILALAGSVDKGLTAYDEMDKSLAGIAKTAKKTMAASFDPLKEERKLAKDGGIESEWRSLVERQIRANWDPAVATYTKANVAIAEINGRFDALSESFTDLGLGITAAEIAAQKNRELEDTLVALAVSGEATVDALEQARQAFPDAANAIDRAVEVARRAAAFTVDQVRTSAASTLNPYFRPSANSIIAATGMNPADKPELWNKITAALGSVGGNYATNIDVIGRLAQDIITGHQHLMATNPQAFQSIVQSVTGYAQAMQAQAQTIAQGQAQINAAIRGGRRATVAELYLDLGLAADAFPETARRLTVLFDALDDGAAGAVEWQMAFDGMAANLRTGKITGEQFSALLGEMTTRMQTASQLIASGRSLSEWIDRLHSTPMGNQSPQEQGTAAMDAFKRQVALARTGDATAYGNLTQYAETLITAQRALSATGVDTSNVIGWVESTLKNLPAVQSWEQQQVALLGKIDANTAATAGGISGVIGAINTGSGSGGGTSAPAGVKISETPLWSAVDVAQSGSTNALNNRVSYMMSNWWKDAAGNAYSWDTARYLQLNPDVASFSISDASFLSWFGTNITDPRNLGDSFATNLLKLDQAQRHFIIHGAGEQRRFASGTPAAPPGWAWVGEEGPELRRLPGGTAIVPNPAAVSMARTWEDTVTRWSAPAPVVPQVPDFDGFNAGITSELRAVRGAVDDLAAAVGRMARDDQTQRARIAEAFDETFHRMHDTLEEIERRMRAA